MNWTKETIHEAVVAQRSFFETGITLPVSWRIEQLQKLKNAVKQNQALLEDALRQDLGRCSAEAYLADIGTVLLETQEAIDHVREWAKPEKHFSGLLNFPSLVTNVYKMPYGVTLIISPFNFPFLLSLGVLSAAMAGGNTAVIKASSKSVQCTKVLKKMIAETFPAEYVTVVDGGHDLADACLQERVDKIFYTGSPAVGRHVLRMAAENLVPTALELGGENGNWCIVRKDANLRDAAEKIAFFKSMNAGQVCININQVAIASEVADEFLIYLREAFIQQLGVNPHENEEYACLINDRAYEGCVREAQQYADRILFGGKGDLATRKFDPTVFYPIAIDEPIVQHELFNPLLPVVPFADAKIEELLRVIQQREHGLAFYLFTKDTAWAKRVLSTMQYGGGCINEVCNHLIVKGVPFNGTGHSGMGAYHGVWGFREFTHPSTVLIGSSSFRLSIRQHPYSALKKKILERMEK